MIAVSAVGIVLVVVALLVLALAGGGYVAAARRTRARERTLVAELAAAEGALAQAHASDKGWDRGLLESAAREVAAARFGATPIDALLLVQVVDRPGTDADQAVFRVQTADGDEHRITLGRTGGVWGPA